MPEMSGRRFTVGLLRVGLRRIGDRGELFAVPLSLGNPFSAVTFEHRLHDDNEEKQHSKGWHQGEHGVQHPLRITLIVDEGAAQVG